MATAALQTASLEAWLFRTVHICGKGCGTAFACRALERRFS
jgi:hypothetical protein